MIADNFTWMDVKGLTYDRMQLPVCRINENSLGIITPNLQCKIHHKTENDAKKNFQVLNFGFSSKYILIKNLMLILAI